MRLAPGVDLERFGPAVDGSEVRRRYGLDGRPVIVCVSRLMARKGQDTLIRALPLVRRAVPDAALLVVGGGPYRERLERLVAERGLQRHVVLTGAVPGSELPAHFAAGDVFAMPCRTRNHGLDVEGLGIVYLEASATGLPVVAGRLGRCPGCGAGGYDRVRRRRPGSPGRGAEPGCSVTPTSGRAWVRPAGPGWRPSGRGTRWRRRRAPCWSRSPHEGPALETPKAPERVLRRRDVSGVGEVSRRRRRSPCCWSSTRSCRWRCTCR